MNASTRLGQCGNSRSVIRIFFCFIVSAYSKAEGIFCRAVDCQFTLDSSAKSSLLSSAVSFPNVENDRRGCQNFCRAPQRKSRLGHPVHDSPVHNSVALNVSPIRTSPVSNPLRNQRERCSDVPCVNESGTT